LENYKNWGGLSRRDKNFKPVHFKGGQAIKMSPYLLLPLERR
jgi:hypothetical protein